MGLNYSKRTSMRFTKKSYRILVTHSGTILWKKCINLLNLESCWIANFTLIHIYLFINKVKSVFVKRWSKVFNDACVTKNVIHTLQFFALSFDPFYETHSESSLLKNKPYLSAYDVRTFLFKIFHYTLIDSLWSVFISLFIIFLQRCFCL